jgi:hypothetical protein
MIPVARERPQKKITARVTAEMAERIVAAALAQPTFGADRLARLLGDEGVSVSRGLVYRTLRGRGLQSRELLDRFLEEQTRLEKPADSREPKHAPEPSPEALQEQPREAPGPPVSIPGIEYAASPAPAPAEDKPEIPAGVVPAYVAAPAGAARIDLKEQAEVGKEEWLFRGINLLLALMVF